MEFTNEYLNQKLFAILDGGTNFFDVVLQLKEFEKEYKQSDFYKKTKLDLMDLIENAKMFYLTNTKILTDKINNIINGITVDKILEVLEQGGSILESNNEATLAQLQEFKELGGAEIIKNQRELDNRNKKVN